MDPKDKSRTQRTSNTKIVDLKQLKDQSHGCKGQIRISWVWRTSRTTILDLTDIKDQNRALRDIKREEIVDLKDHNFQSDQRNTKTKDLKDTKDQFDLRSLKNKNVVLEAIKYLNWGFKGPQWPKVWLQRTSRIKVGDLMDLKDQTREFKATQGLKSWI